ncbi:hypothetical protein P280DRAFT_62129 [Massarina eburnea CBS 473.64]|uniref:Uncharacterized protein n=1 Tax=Massarina eburnea CBS 473.64 TaxID=1395130 RepID=A0A6A6RUT5_9PLEO|nr:hypothetical protein P280DRAFT_62129 [Massarina eburnea CBS 473.64]
MTSASYKLWSQRRCNGVKRGEKRGCLAFGRFSGIGIDTSPFLPVTFPIFICSTLLILGVFDTFSGAVDREERPAFESRRGWDVVMVPEATAVFSVSLSNSLRLALRALTAPGTTTLSFSPLSNRHAWYQSNVNRTCTQSTGI